MTQNEMLDRAKDLLSITHDQDLAAAIGVDQSTISKVRRGKSNLGPETALRLAEILGIDPAKVAAAAYAARATSSSAKRKWEKAAALAIVLAAGVGGTMSIDPGHSLNIMRSRARGAGLSPTQSGKRRTDRNRPTTIEVLCHEVRRTTHLAALGTLARREDFTGRHHHQRRSNHRPSTARPPVMESRFL